MSEPERSPERDAAIDLVLPLVARHGWRIGTLRDALAASGGEKLEAELLFPGGALDLIEAHVDLADRRMAAAAAARGIGELRTTARVRALMAIRLEQARPHKDAVRRALAVLFLPRNAAIGSRTLVRTVDAIWYEAGDRSADFSWYTKRGLLAGVYSATTLYWLRDPGDDDTATLEFLDRRLADIGTIGRLRGRLGTAMSRFRPDRGEAA